MASYYRATAKDLLEHTRRLVGNHEPPQLARIAMTGIVRYARRLRGWNVDGDHPGEAAAGQLTYDASFRHLLNQPDGLGHLWQALNEPMLQQAYASAKGTRKFSKDEIPYVTQLFTPAFVIDQLLHETLSPNHGPEARGTRKAVRSTFASSTPPAER